ncbi:MAG: tRNA pseudouridine(38-40) synthase TruA [Acidimicrobiales bacterium]
MTLWKATVAYDGSGFHGFAVNADVRTVAGEIEEALATVTRSQVTISCAGRTDRGVHSRGQVISFETPDDGPVSIEAGKLQHSLNRLCGPEIAVRDLQSAPVGFDARFSATWRRYRYRVSTAPIANPLLRDVAWHVPESLDIAAMNSAARALHGEHDFASFCRRPDSMPDGVERSLVREVLEAEWTRHVGDDDSLLTFEVRATSFCHQMVRSLVGTCVDVGLGRFDAGSIPSMLDAKDRRAAGRVAPPHGLVLWDVGY